MSFSKPSVSGLLATAILATGALAKTDIAGCTTTNTVVYGGASVIWYVPGTGEICEALDCGGGRAPPKTTVPGCPAYSGTASYSPSYLPGYGAGATSSPVADNVAATATGSVVAPGYAAPPAASSSAVGAIVVAPSVSSIKGFEPVITPAPAVSSSVIPVVKSGMSMSISLFSPPVPPHPSASASAMVDSSDDYCSSSSDSEDDTDSSDSDTDDDDCAGTDAESTMKVVPSSSGAVYAVPPVVSSTKVAGLVATPTPARSTPLQFTGAAAGVVGVKGAMVALAGVAVAGFALL
ncbi:uncharacterized protein BKA78DRAFT_291832 [Phyllosticta capitalensis]|uniref:uncharacterized protein n=1 Tax=Phyllosticta capitalensis TaxID=121624 RepID=UPI00313264BA